MSKKGTFNDYQNLVEKVDAFCERVSEKYADEIACAKGCSECCKKILSFFRVEFFSIVDYIQKNHIDESIIIDNIDAILSKNSRACPLLHNDECLIYDARPIICRTFGLPAIVVDDEGETIDLQICDKNFVKKGLKLEKEYIININTLNSMLFIINSAFVKIYQGYDDKNVRLNVLEIINYI